MFPLHPILPSLRRSVPLVSVPPAATISATCSSSRSSPPCPRPPPPGILHKNPATLTQTRNSRYKPYIKPIRGSVAVYKYGAKKRGETQQTIDTLGLEQQKQLLDAATGREDPPPETKINEEQRVKMLSLTPFQGMRYLHAFHTINAAEHIIFRTKLDVDLSRESVRGTCRLPHGLKTKTRLLVICRDAEAEQMREAGADFAGLSEPIARIQKGWLGFDKVITTQSMMRELLKVARILGPKKLMPSPKSGTVVENILAAIDEVKGGALLDYRAEGSGEIRCVLGDTSFPSAKVLDNVKLFVGHLLRTRGAAQSSKGEGGSLISGDPGTSKKQKSKLYFLESSLQVAGGGPEVHLDPETVMPTNPGYFR